MLLPVMVLIAVALNEPRLFHQEGLTSWKGGGFGMFATLDRHTFRPLIVTVNIYDRETETTTPIQIDFRSYRSLISNDVDKRQHLEDTLSLPTQNNLSVLASQIAEFKYITDQGDYAIASKEGFGIPISSRQITLELYRMKYDDATNKGTYELIKKWVGRDQ